MPSIVKVESTSSRVKWLSPNSLFTRVEYGPAESGLTWYTPSPVSASNGRQLIFLSPWSAMIPDGLAYSFAVTTLFEVVSQFLFMTKRSGLSCVRQHLSITRPSMSFITGRLGDLFSNQAACSSHPAGSSPAFEWVADGSTVRLTLTSCSCTKILRSLGSRPSAAMPPNLWIAGQKAFLMQLRSDGSESLSYSRMSWISLPLIERVKGSRKQRVTPESLQVAVFRLVNTKADMDLFARMAGPTHTSKQKAPNFSSLGTSIPNVPHCVFFQISLIVSSHFFSASVLRHVARSPSSVRSKRNGPIFIMWPSGVHWPRATRPHALAGS